MIFPIRGCKGNKYIERDKKNIRQILLQVSNVNIRFFPGIHPDRGAGCKIIDMDGDDRIVFPGFHQTGYTPATVRRPTRRKPC